MRRFNRVRFGVGVLLLLLATAFLIFQRQRVQPDLSARSPESSPENAQKEVKGLSARTTVIPEHPPGPAPSLASPEPAPEFQNRADAGKVDGTGSRSLPEGSLALIRGRVFDESDESPVPGACVNASSAKGDSRSMIADSEGVFSFSVPRRSVFDIEVDADGYTGFQRSKVYVDAVTELSVGLKKEFIVRGRVIDQHGQPVEGAGLWVLLPDGSGSRSGSRSGPDGTFQVRLGPRGLKDGKLEMRAEHPGASRSPIVPVDLSTEELVVLRLDLAEDPALVWGIVSDRDGNPIPGIRVELSGPNLGMEVAFSDDEGAYRHREVAPGRYVLLPRAPELGSLAGDTESRKYLIVESRQEYRVDFVMDTGETVEGRVVSPAGVPLPDASILLELPAGRSTGSSTTWVVVPVDEEGRFVLRGLRRDLRYPLTAQHPDFQESRIELTVPCREGIEFVLQEGLTLSGTVKDGQGTALSGAVVSVRKPGGTEMLREISLEGTSGTFEMRGLPAGTLQLFVTPPDTKTRFGTIEIFSDLRVVLIVGDALRILPY